MLWLRVLIINKSLKIKFCQNSDVGTLALAKGRLHERKKVPLFSFNFGPVCSKSLGFSAETRPFLISYKRSLTKDFGFTLWLCSFDPRLHYWSCNCSCKKVLYSVKLSFLINIAALILFLVSPVEQISVY